MSLFRTAFRDVFVTTTIATVTGSMVAARYPSAFDTADQSIHFSANFDGVGAVTDGYRKGSVIEENVKIDARSLNGSGTLNVQSELAAR